MRRKGQQLSKIAWRHLWKTPKKIQDEEKRLSYVHLILLQNKKVDHLKAETLQMEAIGHGP